MPPRFQCSEETRKLFSELKPVARYCKETRPLLDVLQANESVILIFAKDLMEANRWSLSRGILSPRLRVVGTHSINSLHTPIVIRIGRYFEQPMYEHAWFEVMRLRPPVYDDPWTGVEHV